jgi:tellurite resistance protein TerC
VVMALVLRGAFIAAGASAISRFGWVLYVFGGLLMATAIRLAVSGRQAPKAAAPPSDRLARMLARVGGARMATPVVVLIIAIAATDLAFAFDSIPAIFGLTRDPYLVFTANVFALLGLRHLYFLIGGLLQRLAHLSAGLAVILGFIGVKLVAEALHESGVHAVGPVPVPVIGTGVSLAVVGGVLLVVTITSLLAGHRQLQAADPAQVEPGPAGAADQADDDLAADRAASHQAGAVGVDHGRGDGAAVAARGALAHRAGEVHGEQLAEGPAKHVPV